jgi:hypothetical protein
VTPSDWTDAICDIASDLLPSYIILITMRCSQRQSKKDREIKSPEKYPADTNHKVPRRSGYLRERTFHTKEKATAKKLWR